MVLKVTLKDAQDSPESISQNPSQEALDLALRPHRAKRATGSMHLAWLLKVVSTKPEAYARESDAEEAAEGEGQQRCPPSQVEARWTAAFHQSPRALG